MTGAPDILRQIERVVPTLVNANLPIPYAGLKPRELKLAAGESAGFAPVAPDQKHREDPRKHKPDRDRLHISVGGSRAFGSLTGTVRTDSLQTKQKRLRQIAYFVCRQTWRAPSCRPNSENETPHVRIEYYTDKRVGRATFMRPGAFG
jgi:hypothetical protein